MSAPRLTKDEGDRTLLRACPRCGQAGKVELHGERLAVTCWGGCSEDAVLGVVDVERIRDELRDAVSLFMWTTPATASPAARRARRAAQRAFGGAGINPGIKLSTTESKTDSLEPL